MTTPLLSLQGISKQFTLHHQNAAQLRVLDHVDLDLYPGECVVLDGPSGQGKSTLLKLVYANYRATTGRMTLRQQDGHLLDITQASERDLIRVRRDSIGYVSQFLRVIPRVSALDVVAEPLLGDVSPSEEALAAARQEAMLWLTKLRIPERLWPLPPATFSGGEQQRINIARSMIKPRPVLLLDEPTASLDKVNSKTVIELIHNAIARGAALLGIFHDAEVRDAVATRRIEVACFRSAV